MLVMFLMLPELVQSAAVEAASPPISIELVRGGGYATMINQRHPDNRIGYRFHEHTPIVCGEIPASDTAAGVDPKAVDRSEAAFLSQPGVVTCALSINDEGWVVQQWRCHLAPVQDGVDLLWVVETFDTGLARYYGVQQCFRMGGKSNAEWRRAIAETPAFSEFDAWDVTEKDLPAKTSLTYVLRKDSWQPFPAVRETVGARTPLGVRIDTERTGGHIESMPEVGPYQAKMLGPVDSGLVTRADASHAWVCGLYWERTSHVTDHHPADCLHAIVNIGNIPPHSKRALHGKIYWFKGSLDDLTKHWKKDFPTASE